MVAAHAAPRHWADEVKIVEDAHADRRCGCGTPVVLQLVEREAVGGCGRKGWRWGQAATYFDVIGLAAWIMGVAVLDAKNHPAGDIGGEGGGDCRAADRAERRAIVAGDRRQQIQRATGSDGN